MATRFDGSLSVILVGDVAVRQAEGSDNAFGNTLPILQDADITLANLEGVVCDESLPPLPGKTEAGSGGHLRMPSGPIEKALKLAKVDAVSIANNHAVDYREEGVVQTVEALDRAGIPHAGVGRNLQEAHCRVSALIGHFGTEGSER